MNLEGILTIAGKPGLHKLIAQSRGGVIVEALADGKRTSIPATKSVSALKDIAIFTYQEEMPLNQVFENLHKEVAGDVAKLPQTDADMRKLFGKVVPGFDQDRVYNSDIKKVYNWYRILLSHGLVETAPAEEETPVAAAEEAPKPKKKAAPKKAKE